MVWIDMLWFCLTRFSLQISFARVFCLLSLTLACFGLLGLLSIVWFGLARLDVVWYGYYMNYNLVARGAHGLHVQLLLPRLQSTQRVPPTRSQVTSQPTEYTEWQRSLSGVHSIMMEKIAQAGEVHAHPLQYTCHHVQSCGVRSS
jgi:hypothetical protein